MNPATHETPTAIVRVEDVHKAYRRGSTTTPVLSGVDLVVRRGECVYLAGPSGSGKTTLLSILGCILSADRGSVRLLDQDVHCLSPPQRSALRLHRVGFVFQKFHLIHGLTAINNVCVPLTLRGLTRRAAYKRAMPLLDAVGLEGKATAHPRSLSAGQCQRVALARALVGEPDLILADEPTASLDAANGREVMKLLRRLTTQEGKTAIVVTHDQRIFDYADRLCWLDSGRIVETMASGSTSDSESGGD